MWLSTCLVTEGYVSLVLVYPYSVCTADAYIILFINCPYLHFNPTIKDKIVCDVNGFRASLPSPLFLLNPPHSPKTIPLSQTKTIPYRRQKPSPFPDKKHTLPKTKTIPYPRQKPYPTLDKNHTLPQTKCQTVVPEPRPKSHKTIPYGAPYMPTYTFLLF